MRLLRLQNMAFGGLLWLGLGLQVRSSSPPSWWESVGDSMRLDRSEFTTPGGAAKADETVELTPVEPGGRFVDATLPQALQLVCSIRREDLKSFLESRSLPFERNLVRKIGNKQCHLFYEPTVLGFRADPDDDPIKELYFADDTIRFLSMKPDSNGDTLDLVKSLLKSIDRPLVVKLGLSTITDDKVFDQASEFHFFGSPHQVTLTDSHTDSYCPWVQDYLKSGRVDGAPVRLIPYHLYESIPENKQLYHDLLDHLDDEPSFIRSKLSWEGGDLQFTRHPRDPAKLILFYGDAAKPYWGEFLTPQEYAYVLKLEFGADVAVDLGHVAPHIDYFTAFLPADKIALVGIPLTGNLEVARDAVAALLAMARDPSAPELLELQKLLLTSDLKSDRKKQRLVEALDRARQNCLKSTQSTNENLWVRLADYVRVRCPDNESLCLSRLGQIRMASDNLPLLREWVSSVLAEKSEQELMLSYLAIIESQLSDVPDAVTQTIEERIEDLNGLGFRVIAIPKIAGEFETIRQWAGISYVNSLLIDRTLFVPRFGLGASEDAMFSRIQNQLPPSYKVVPVFAQHLLIHHGGLHCITGIGR